MESKNETSCQLSMTPSAIAARQRRAAETPADQRQARLQANRECRKRKVDQLQHGERMRSTERRANETPDQRENRLVAMREHASERRADETQDEREHHLTARHLRFHQRKATENVALRNVAVSIDIDENSVIPHNCGKLEILCEYCHAKHFAKEKPSDRKFTQCCQKGKVELEPIRVSSLLKRLMTNSHEQLKKFMGNIRSFNSALAFVSMGADLSSPPGYGPYCFKIHGQIYHCAGVVHPANGEPRKYTQLYILDPDSARDQRLALSGNNDCNKQLMGELSTFMVQNNPFAAACKMLYEVEQECIADARRQGVSTPPTLSMAILQDRNLDPRRYNAQRVNEVAIIFQNAEGEPPLERDLLIHCRANGNGPNTRKMEHINVLDPNLDPLVYPLFFPYSDQGWGINIPLQNRPTALLDIRPPAANPRTRITQMQFYSYRFSIRGDFNQFLCGGKLTQQYFVDSYVKTEANRLNYHRQNQSALRVELYKGLVDHLNSRADAEGLVPGKAFILPSSFQGSPRNMAQNYQDAMAIVRRYGKPDLFVTMTCNPKWEEITENLEHGPEFRPDLVARVFQLKLSELLDDICKKHILGVPSAKIHVIEFQKRGLPHAHILIILKQEHKPIETDVIDKLVSAEIPNIDTHPRLHAILTKHMIHGPCSEHNLMSPCMENGQCSKSFPKDFQMETVANVDGYPKYHKREDRTAVVNGKTTDNP